MNFPGPCFRVDDNAKSYEPAFVVPDLTFLHISFAILFCQKKVKKNCKSAVRVFSKKADTRHRKRHEMYVPDFQLWFTGRGCADLSLHKQNTHRPYPHPLGHKKTARSRVFSLLLAAHKNPVPDGITAYLPWCSSDTVSFLRPWARREANTRRPFFVDILSRKPCLFTLLLLWGWNVLFIFYLKFYLLLFTLWAAKLLISF